MAAVSVRMIDVMPSLIINGCCINTPINASNENIYRLSYRQATASMMKNEGEPLVRWKELQSIRGSKPNFKAKLQHDLINIWF